MAQFELKRFFFFRFNQSANADDYTDSRKPPAPRSFRKMVNVTLAIEHRKDKVIERSFKVEVANLRIAYNLKTTFMINLRLTLRLTFSKNETSFSTVAKMLGIKMFDFDISYDHGVNASYVLPMSEQTVNTRVNHFKFITCIRTGDGMSIKEFSLNLA